MFKVGKIWKMGNKKQKGRIMKKISAVLAILLSVWAISAHGWWNKETEPSKPKLEMKAGQIWRNMFSGNTYEIMEVGVKYIVYQSAEGSYKSPDTKTQKKFLEDYKLIKDVPEVTEGIVWGAVPCEALIIVLDEEDPNDPSVCTHSKLVAKDKDDFWVLRMSKDKYGSLFHRLYICQNCESELLIASATRIFERNAK